MNNVPFKYCGGILCLLRLWFAPHIKALCTGKHLEIRRENNLRQGRLCCLLLLSSPLSGVWHRIWECRISNGAFYSFTQTNTNHVCRGNLTECEKQAQNMIKGNRTDESSGGKMFTEVIIFSRKCWKNKNSHCQSASRQNTLPRRMKTSKRLQVLFETYSIFYIACQSSSSDGFKSRRTKVIGKSVFGVNAGAVCPSPVSFFL